MQNNLQLDVTSLLFSQTSPKHQTAPLQSPVLGIDKLMYKFTPGKHPFNSLLTLKHSSPKSETESCPCVEWFMV